MEYVPNSVGVLKKVILGKPEHWEIIPVSDTARDAQDYGEEASREKAFEHHNEFTQAFKENGVEVAWIEPNEEQPWQSVARDWGVMTKAGALIGKFRYYERKGEERNAIKFFKDNDIPIIGQVKKGAFEGGDCWFIDEHTLAVGVGNRSTHTGVSEAAEILKDYDIEVIPVEFHAKWNHLDMIFTLINENLAIGTSDALPDYFLGLLKGKGIEFVDFSGDKVKGTCYLNLMPLGNDKIMSFKSNKINDKLKSLGLEVIDPVLNQFTRTGAGPHCMSHELIRGKSS